MKFEPTGAFAQIPIVADVFPDVEPPLERQLDRPPVDRWAVIAGTHVLPLDEAAHVLKAYRRTGVAAYVAIFTRPDADVPPELDRSLFRRPS